MKKWKVDTCLVATKLEAKLNEIQQANGTILQILPATNPHNCYVVWSFVEKAQ